MPYHISRLLRSYSNYDAVVLVQRWTNWIMKNRMIRNRPCLFIDWLMFSQKTFSQKPALSQIWPMGCSFLIPAWYIPFCLSLAIASLSKNFYWSIVDLQYCISFRCTAKWFSYTYIYIYIYISPPFSFSDSLTIKAIVDFAVLYSRFFLVIYFINYSVYMSIPTF